MLRYDFDWSLITRPQFVDLILDGLGRTGALAVASGLLSLLLGGLIAAARLSPTLLVRTPANAFVEVVRNVPALFWILFFYFVAPELLPTPAGRWLHEWPGYAFAAGVLGLGLDNGAYLSDILRNGMARIAQGQRDAAASCGLTRWQEWRCVLLPQAVRAMMPAIANRMVHNFKNTSLCMAIALPELTWATQQIESITFKGLEVTAVSTLIYSAGSLLIAVSLARLAGRRASAAAAMRGDRG